MEDIQHYKNNFKILPYFSRKIKVELTRKKKASITTACPFLFLGHFKLLKVKGHILLSYIYSE